jgi:V8-like Glu-specific endopeptidase
MLPKRVLERIAAGAVLAGAALAFTSCGKGFQAIKPSESNEDLVYRFNHELLATGLPLNFAPREMPGLPPGSQPPEPLPPDQKQQRTIDPEFAAPPITPLKDGDVMLADINVGPYNRVGRLETSHPSDPPGWGSTCTAQLIGPHGVLLTAAHCIYDNVKREWPRTMMFKLQYDQGSYTQQFNWECAAMVSGWPNGHYKYDYALVKLRGTPPAGLGMTINVNGGRVDAVGYPSKYYSAQRLVHVFGVRDTGNPSGMLNDMGKGSSGGARILDSGTLTDVVSVNSFFYTNNPSRLYGPVLTNTTMKVYDFVARSCRDSVPGGGAPLPAVSSLLNQDEYTTVQARRDVSPAFGASIDSAAHESCPCDKKVRYTLHNASKQSRRLVGVQRLSTHGDSRVEVDTEYLTLEASETRVLGCARTTPEAGLSCTVDNQYKLVSDRRLRVAKPQMPKAPGGVTVVQALGANDIAYCTAQCDKNNNDVCLNLGLGAVASLAPLAKFVNVVDTSSGLPDGVLAKKDDVVKEFGGDQSKEPDVCERSDISRVGPNAVNEGFGCLLTTKELVPNAGLRTRLNMRANVRGTPTAWSGTLASLVPKPTTFFTDRELAPAIDFENEPVFTEKFGGDVHAASIVDDKQIVLATSNGCMIGHYRKP